MEPDFQISQGRSNRMLEAVLLHAEQEAEHRINSPTSKANDPQALELKRRHYNSIIQGYRGVKGKTAEEKKTLRFVRHELRKTKVQQNPSFLLNLLYSHPVNWLFNTLLRRQDNYKAHNEILNTYGKSTALEVNAVNLQESIKAYGFKNQLEGPIKKRLAHNPPEFSLRYYDIAKPDTDYVLHFKKLPSTEAYYFEGFDATHRPTVQAIRRKEPSAPIISFNTADKLQFNAEEARQLAADRPLQKNIAGESVWVIQDTTNPIGLRKMYFDPATALKNLPIRELQPSASRNTLIKDLTAGKQREITLFLPDGRKQTLHVSLGLDVYRQNMQLIFRDADDARVDVNQLIKDRTVAKQILNSIQASKTNLKKTTLSRPIRA